MLETSGIVTRVENAVAYVETQRTSGCGHCSTEGGCASATYAKFFGAKPTAFKALNPIGAEVGDQVVIGVEEGAVWRGSLVVYLIPLALLLIGALAGSFWASGDAYAVLGAGAGAVLGYVWLRAASAVMAGRQRYQPVILKKAGVSLTRAIRFQ